MIKKALLIIPLILSSCAQERVNLDLPALVAQADQYGLPRPPSKAKLILTKTEATTTTANRSSDLDPSIYEPGFLLEKRPDGSAKVMTGFHKSLSQPRRQHQPAIRPFSATPTRPKPGSYAFHGNSQITFATAIQCARLGDLETAQDLLNHFYRADYKDVDFDTKHDHLLPENAHLLLALTTFDYHYQHLRQKDADLKKSLTILTKIEHEFPTLFSKDKEDYFSHKRTSFLSDLRLTVRSPAAKPNSIEDLIYQSAYLDIPAHMREDDHPISKIHFQGTSAIPELVRLSTSQKLTPAIQPAIMNSRERRLRLGHLASAILEDMTGALTPGTPKNTLFFRSYTSDDRWKRWLPKANLADEKLFFIKALGKIELEQKHDIGIPLSILLHKSPTSALELSDRFANSKNPSLFISAVSNSKLDKPTKVKVLIKVAQNQKGLDRLSLLQVLAKLDPKIVKKELLSLIKSLPSDVDEPYWTAQEANLTHLVMQLDDPLVWKTYLVKAKNCSVGLRMEFMNPMNYSYIGKKNQNLRLAFLAAFLNDTEVRTIYQNDKRWEGPHAGFTFDTLSVQNFVASKIASILDIPGEPADFWTEKQWSPFRKSVRAALSKLILPELLAAE